MPIAQRILGREKDLGGGFVVRRLLPAPRQRSVGPFVFLDHMGPAHETPDTDHDVRPHPHIGLATVTYLFEGAMMHRDSLGNRQLIEPGAINLMSAGRGIVHSERRPDHLRRSSYVVHGLQMWTALPLDREEGEPSFVHTPARDIPSLAIGDAQVRVLIGDAFGARSPVAAASPTLYLDVELRAGARIELPPLALERAVYTVEGDVDVDGERAECGTLAVLQPGAASLVAGARARLVVVGGAPLDAPRLMWWNFVSSRKERIVQASDDWAAQRFGRVVDDEREFIPLPARRFTPPEPMS
jgi:redox-sensitive bicupin YhaK (pirin superfamily)